MKQNSGPFTEAFDIVPENSNLKDIQMIRATTRQVENEHFQRNRTRIYVASGDNAQGDKMFTLRSDQHTIYYRFVLTADIDKSVALKEMLDGKIF